MTRRITRIRAKKNRLSVIEMQMQCYGYARKDGQWKKEDDTKELHRVWRPFSTQYYAAENAVGSDITDSALS